ncbi:MAG: methyl-accepting chemotaxis protein [Deltaproteobacteria bacterium]|nr:methyl-accepting chemotaxis protein [Deltaproteobacteria bacterium]
MNRKRIPLGTRLLLASAGGAFLASFIVVGYVQLFPGLPFATIVLVAVAAAGVPTLFVQWRVVRPLSDDMEGLIDASKRVTAGKLDQPVALAPGRPDDEITEVAEAIDRLRENIKALVNQIQGTARSLSTSTHNLSATAEQMSSSTAEIASTMADISRGTESQSALVETTTKSMREMVEALKMTDRSARDGEASATLAAKTARESSELARQAVDKMADVFARVEASAKLVVEFSNKTKQVNKIVDVISGIAQKTTLLSLNATIEAARAGEYGRGFAVVADEIRKLAESTTTSAEAISDLIEGIDAESRRVFESMQTSITMIEKGRVDITTVGNSLEAIVASVAESESLAKQISDFATGQTDQSQRMLKAIEDIQKVAENVAAATMEISASTQEQTSSMQQMAKSAQDLSRMAETLKMLANRFQVSSEPALPGTGLSPTDDEVLIG